MVCLAGEHGGLGVQHGPTIQRASFAVGWRVAPKWATMHLELETYRTETQNRSMNLDLLHQG